jgi:NADH-quinone oxidoreductase subunit J
MNILITLIFFFVAALILFAGVMVVATKNIIHSALWLIASFFGVAALYMLMEAPFLGVVQVLIYVGAVSILILFAIMLTRQVMVNSGEAVFYRRWWLALGVAVLLFGAALVPTLIGGQPALTQATGAAQQGLGEGRGVADVFALGVAYINDYLIPFQVAGVLLLVALIGAIMVASEERVRRRRVLTLAEEHALRQRAANGAVAVDGVQREANDTVVAAEGES